MRFSWQHFVHLRTIERWLLPVDLEREPRFREALFSAGRSGLRMLGIMETAIAAFFTYGALRIGLGAVGLATIAFASIPRVRRHVRTITVISGLTTGSILIVSNSEGLVASLALLMLGVICAAPLIPLQTCVLGSALGLVYGIFTATSGSWDAHAQLFILFLTCFATWASGMFYDQKRQVHEAHQRSLAFQETLTAAQTRAQLSETAMSLGRLAAALTHEINTPLGALNSGMGTLLLLAERQARAKPEEQDRLARAQDDLSRSMRSSIERLSSVVTRLKRLIALEQDEKQTASVNDLLTDAGLIVEKKLKPDVHVLWNLQPVADVVCSTHQLTTVFANLLSNSISAIDGEGRITVTTKEMSGNVEILIADTGRGMQPEEADTIFDPGFRIENGHVLGGNWSLFTARQIINEHGGEIWIESEPGRGTTAHLSLPSLR